MISYRTKCFISPTPEERVAVIDVTKVFKGPSQRYKGINKNST
jgi:hypothetical protein